MTKVLGTLRNDKMIKVLDTSRNDKSTWYNWE